MAWSNFAEVAARATRRRDDRPSISAKNVRRLTNNYLTSVFGFSGHVDEVAVSLSGFVALLLKSGGAPCLDPRDQMLKTRGHIRHIRQRVEIDARGVGHARRIFLWKIRQIFRPLASPWLKPIHCFPPLAKITRIRLMKR